ncbi:zf-HC2 domain-containing protein [Streptomyces sp. NPDC048489]|uniref:zf-HC2 domain-containing protein n=1 Tax=Streptomyces sp. NPDC048489 TaxID=3154504 RepID=UPI00344390AE
MSTNHPGGERLGAFVLGLLDLDERKGVEQHFKRCETCRIDLKELHKVEENLGEVPNEIFLEGPPDDGEILLQRTLRLVRSEVAVKNRRRSLTVGLMVAASTALALFGASILIDSANSLNQSPPPNISPNRIIRGSSVRIASARDAVSGTNLTIDATPANSGVHLHAVIEGLPTHENCRLLIFSKDGEEQIVGKWAAPAPTQREASASTSLNGLATIPLERIKTLVVENERGERFISVSLYPHPGGNSG